ncbi:hypothetical protein LMG29660_01954 [Burkholderia puraquae]|uniref:Uncharacterized protein n=1 Tax=Burkholderia puraquae TaxID=1904757 RepID=A0A6J5DGH8_9BURK|nr:hypothetical protein LMG29660_01954 [Burkholderia puraquae]
MPDFFGVIKGVFTMGEKARRKEVGGMLTRMDGRRSCRTMPAVRNQSLVCFARAGAAVVSPILAFIASTNARTFGEGSRVDGYTA